MSANTSTIQENESSDEEEVEPKLKYVRMSNDLKRILNKDAVSCIAVHSKFLCIGTHWGAVHLLDHQGNTVDNSINNAQDFPVHMVSVNQISIDNKGEYIATCSDEGTVVISGFYTDENNYNIKLGRAVKTIALDPVYYKSGSGRRFIIGDQKLTLHEKTFLKGLKQTVLCEAEGVVSAIAWTDHFVAWASVIGVRVYDLNEKCSLGLIKWEEPKDQLLNDFRCNLKWSNSTTLLIGWVDIVRICVIRKRNSVEVSTRGLPDFIVDPISTFQMDCYICGLGPLESDQLVVLGYPKEKDPTTNKALRPILCVIQYKSYDYEEICTNSLSLRGYSEYKVNDYHLDTLIEENQYFIVSPKDIVVASLYENDDRVKWFIEHEKFEQAMQVISEHGGKYSLVSVARLYLDHLLEQKKYDEAAKLCQQTFGNDKVLWEEEVFKFVKVQKLRSVSRYLPRGSDCKLKPHVYEMVLYEYLQFDAQGFLVLIKEWDPSLYNTSAVINAVHEQFNERDKDILLESLALLYSYEHKYEKSLTMYLKLQHKDVFNLIKKYNLYDVIYRTIVPLIQLDSEQAIAMLLERNKIPVDVVVAQLQNHEEYLYLYLDAFDKIDNSGRYHAKLVHLYAKYNREKLLPFLKRSNSYPIEEALSVCTNKLFYPEMVYLHGRMGNTIEALSIIINKLDNIQMAIDFCKEHNDMDLWNELINQSLDRPEIMTKLLDGIAGFINPEILVNKIKMGQCIPGLKDSLVKMLCDLRLQVSIQDGCNDILVGDYFNLHDRHVRCQQKAVYISNDNICGLCQKEIVVKDPLKMKIIAFNCRHFFHEICLPDKYNIEYCTVCKSKKP
ncbi:vacuolar protein sorting-associated protein 41 homolog [Sitodiplosis mosellana]|uniref:vacuolar protein sorting-associated protein 41 homolog n=1 Tax=Sitodiplosis mosellana TaxID=263140 RepID=UPI002443D4BB|nr:vacuolar protein sorting-associated protein 41 homolog [Sitodiplosis mosellana]